MIIAKIQVKRTGNCGCAYCGKVQDGFKLHPFTVWHKRDDEKRGHNEPVCSIDCAKAYIAKIGACDVLGY